MAETDKKDVKEEKKNEVTLEDIKKEIENLKKENAELKEAVKQKDLELVSISLGGTKQVKQETKPDEDIEFDFSF